MAAVNTASSLRNYMERTHVILVPQTQGLDVGLRGPDTYLLSFLLLLNSVRCPLNGFLVRAHNPERLREHFFAYRHWKIKIANPKGGIYDYPTVQPLCDAHAVGAAVETQ